MIDDTDDRAGPGSNVAHRRAGRCWPARDAVKGVIRSRFALSRAGATIGAAPGERHDPRSSVSDRSSWMRGQGSSGNAERRSGWLAQPASLLTLLATRPGQLVTRDEIRRHLWGGEVFVE